MKSRQTDPSAPGKADSSVSPGTVVEFGLKPISVEDWLTFRAFVRKLSGDEKLQFLSQLENAAEIIHEEIALIEIGESIPDRDAENNVFNFQTTKSFE